MFFNHRNPTGHYVLDLDNPCDYSVAVRCRALNDFEKWRAEEEDRPNCSENGDRENWRNLFVNNQPKQFDQSWIIPDFGSDAKITFDYVSPFRPNSKCVMIADDLWKRAVGILGNAKISSYTKIDVVRGISHQVAFSIKQFVRFLQIFNVPGQNPHTVEANDIVMGEKLEAH